MIGNLGRAARSKFAENRRVRQFTASSRWPEGAPAAATRTRTHEWSDAVSVVLRGLRPAHWVKNGLVFAGLVFGGKLFALDALASAVLAAVWFCLLSSGFYLINDVRDRGADRLHPDKRLRPVAAGELAPMAAMVIGIMLVVVALTGSAFMGMAFFLVALSYAALMAAYNLGLKHIVILDVFSIAMGFVLRAVGGAVAVNVAISPWLLVCTMLLALLLGFGKRRHELLSLEFAERHRANLETYTEKMLDQAVAVSATGALVAYAVYSFDSESVALDHRMMVTVPIVAFGIFRYLFLVYGRGQGGAPETILLTDRSLLGTVLAWSVSSVVLFYFAN